MEMVEEETEENNADSGTEEELPEVLPENETNPPPLQVHSTLRLYSRQLLCHSCGTPPAPTRGVVCESDRSVKVTNIGNVKEIRYLLGKMTYFSFQLCLVV